MASRFLACYHWQTKNSSSQAGLDMPPHRKIYYPKWRQLNGNWTGTDFVWTIFTWLRRTESCWTGLMVYTNKLELPGSEILPFEPEKTQALPIARKSPMAGRLALQVHPCAVWHLVLLETLYRLQHLASFHSIGISLFGNYRVLHSVTVLRFDSLGSATSIHLSHLQKSE